MASQVSVAEAKRHFSDLLGRVAYGKERIAITRRGRPMALLVPPESIKPKPHLTDVKGWLPADDLFFRIMDQIIKGRRKHRPRVLR